ncbi:MAG TPA: TMEM175 family protein [Methanobacterium sp.]|nr:TMEM175 family protein [Methanobacterium sp.]
MDKSESTELLMDTKRLETLVDGIFAIAMTLLVLGLAVPQISGPLSNMAVERSLTDLLPNLISMVLSFILLAVFWTIHHRIFKQIKYINSTLLWINIIWLLFIVLVPFSASLTGEYGSYPISHVIFNLNLLSIAFFLHLNWYFANRSGFFHKNVDSRQINTTKKLNVLFIGVAILALALSYIIPSWCEMAYLLIIPLETLIKKK